MAKVDITYLFETDRLRVRQLSADDFDMMMAVYGDVDAMLYVDDGSAITAEETSRWIAITQKNYANLGYGMAAVEEKESGQLIGFIGLVHPGGQQLPELKYSYLRQWWGQGVATEAAVAMVEYGREAHNLDEIIATVDPAHTASQNVLRKAGLHYLCTVEEHGDPTDVYTTNPNNSGYQNHV